MFISCKHISSAYDFIHSCVTDEYLHSGGGAAYLISVCMCVCVSNPCLHTGKGNRVFTLRREGLSPFLFTITVNWKGQTQAGYTMSAKPEPAGS